MISNHDRTGYIGASDTSMVMGNWETKTFRKWFAEKLGFAQPKWNNRYTLAGTHYEHAILDCISPRMEKDKQIIIEGLKLRVNLDGNLDKVIHEVKTHKGPYTHPKSHVQQVNVQMFAFESLEAFIDDYEMTEAEYMNFFLPIDKNRLYSTPIIYDCDFINRYICRLEILADCIKKGRFPNA